MDWFDQNNQNADAIDHLMIKMIYNNVYMGCENPFGDMEGKLLAERHEDQNQTTWKMEVNVSSS